MAQAPSEAPSPPQGEGDTAQAAGGRHHLAVDNPPLTSYHGGYIRLALADRNQA